LKKKGFRVTIFQRNEVSEFIKSLNELAFDVAWIISGHPHCEMQKELKEAVLYFHKEKRGLMVKPCYIFFFFLSLVTVSFFIFTKDLG
jgi:hypothetical protein